MGRVSEYTWQSTYFRLWRYLRKEHPAILDDYIKFHSSRWKKLPRVVDESHHPTAIERADKIAHDLGKRNV